jgi:hypothetical protein
MARTGIALDDIADIADFSDATLLEVADRLERSTTFQEFIAREIELDEVFRRVETSIKASVDAPGLGQERARLGVVFDLVTQAHDLAGEGKPQDAAARLREAVRTKMF